MWSQSLLKMKDTFQLKDFLIKVHILVLSFSHYMEKIMQNESKSIINFLFFLLDTMHLFEQNI